MKRPWEFPNDADLLNGVGATDIKPSRLYDGCDLDRYTMIPAKDIRLILWSLAAEGKRVCEAQYLSLITWLKTNRPELVPFIKVSAPIVPLSVAASTDRECQAFLADFARIHV
jgi:hypothetical protein